MEKNKKILISVIVILFIAVGVVAFKIVTKEPVDPVVEEVSLTLTEEANIILAESIQNTLGLNSFTATGEGAIEIKDGETTLLKVVIEDGQASIINPFDFVKQDSSSVFTYNILMNFEAIAGFIERVKTFEELEELRATGEMLGIDILTTMRALGEANISVTMKMKSIGFDSYTKIVEIKGLKEIVTNVGGVFLAEMAMTGVEPYLGIWYKTPAEPIIIEEMTIMFEELEGLMLSIFNTYYVKEVLPNTKVNGIPVYNFIFDVDLDKLKNVIITSVSLFTGFAEKEVAAEEKEKIIAGINENWPEIVQVIKGMEVDSRVYICQKTLFIVKETKSVKISLSKLIIALESIMRKTEVEMTPEKEVEFTKMKEAVRNINIVGTTNVIYSDHNAIPEILPPAEYEVIEPGSILMPMW